MDEEQKSNQNSDNQQEPIELLFQHSMQNKNFYSLDFSPCGKFLSLTCDQGKVFIFSISKKQIVLEYPQQNSKQAFTCTRWRNPKNEFQSKNVFCYSTSEGQIQGIHLNTQKRIFNIQEKLEGDPQINTFEFNNDSTQIVVGGANPAIRIYDIQTEKLINVLNGEDCVINGHSNRVFSLKYENDQNLLISSGWDQRIIYWDLRTNKPIESIFGCSIYGDSLDICDGLLLACNHRQDQKIQLYDLNSRKLITSQDGSDFQWNENEEFTTLLNFGKFDKIKGKYILTGGVGSLKDKGGIVSGNEAKILDITGQQYVTIEGFRDSVNYGDFSKDLSKFALCSADGQFRIYKNNLKFDNQFFKYYINYYNILTIIPIQLMIQQFQFFQLLKKFMLNIYQLFLKVCSTYYYLFTIIKYKYSIYQYTIYSISNTSMSWYNI